jgi:MerR family copper efflux transcriptional regulator
MVASTRIGEAAETLGTQAHVLRHWEDMALLSPPRSASGHRIYDDEQLTRARLVQLCQRASLSLAEIRALGAADPHHRPGLITEKRDEIRQHMQRLQQADAFLEHVLACRHPIVSECEECVSFATGHTAPPNA